MSTNELILPIAGYFCRFPLCGAVQGSLLVYNMSTSTSVLSADELKHKLYSSLRGKGVLDSLKSQLRNKLVHELQHSVLGSSLKTKPPQQQDDSSLSLTAANSLVADHLRRCHYNYSLGVFIPESGASQDKVFTSQDLLQLLHISPHSKLYKTLTESMPESSSKGFLWQLLTALAGIHAGLSQDTSTQTSRDGHGAMSILSNRLSKVDEEFDTLLHENSKSHALGTEERILSIQRHLEERFKEETKLELERFKETQFTKFKLQEKEKARKEIEKARKEMELTYRAKCDALAERERAATERLQRRQEQQEKELYQQRQSLLEEIDKVREREVEVRKDLEIMKRESHLHEDKMKSWEDMLKKREDSVHRLEEEFDQRLQIDVARFKIEEQGRLLERTKNLEVQEARLSDELKRLGEEREAQQSVREELRINKARVAELEAQIQALHHEKISTSKHYEVAQERLRETVDYRSIKEENAVMKRELETTKMRQAELLHENERERQRYESLLKDMGERTKQPTPESLLLQRELQRAQDRLKQEQAVFEHHKQQSDARIKEEADRNQEILKKFEEQTLQQREMIREITDLRQQLLHTQEALNNEIYRKPRTATLRPQSTAAYMDDMPVHDPGINDMYIDTSLRRTTVDPELQLAGDVSYSGGYGRNSVAPDINDLLDRVDRELKGADNDMLTTLQRQQRQRDGGSPDESTATDIILETRQRLQRLEREAEEFDENYRQFNQRMTNPMAIPDDSYVQQQSRRTPKTAATAAYRVVFDDLPPAPSPLTGSPLRQNTKTSPYSSPSKYTGGATYSSSPTRLRSEERRSSERERPLSSTPFRKSRWALTHDNEDPCFSLDETPDRHSPPTLDGSTSPTSHGNEGYLPSLGMSEVTKRISPVDNREKSPLTRQGPLTLNDLEGRPGSPGVVVFQGSGTSSKTSDHDGHDPAVDLDIGGNQVTRPQDHPTTWHGDHRGDTPTPAAEMDLSIKDNSVTGASRQDKSVQRADLNEFQPSEPVRLVEHDDSSDRRDRPMEEEEEGNRLDAGAEEEPQVVSLDSTWKVKE
ncbi:oral-facial-digital syndrome 1 protein homolog, partial [Lingula anatina]|uniref:Oral-facial-digital syndrome 1 protein homolog n=1 Tax=Lingula anatina TaxID=7574 RepID=A0A2R2MSU1_LINAN